MSSPEEQQQALAMMLTNMGTPTQRAPMGMQQPQTATSGLAGLANGKGLMDLIKALKKREDTPTPGANLPMPDPMNPTAPY